MYEYLFGDLLIMSFWLTLFLYKKNLRKSMIWSGIIFVVLLVIVGALTIVLSHFTDITWKYIPDYWNPTTLFNLGQRTGVDGIEGIIFAFLVGGIASVLYEVLFKRKMQDVKTRHHILSLFGFGVSYVLIAYLFDFNVIYNLVISSLIGGTIIIIQRRDLFRHALYGALAFTAVYFIGFSIFNVIFPEAVQTYWSLQNLIGLMILGIPVEEFMWAFSFGLMWAPLYEYVHGNKIK